MSFVEILGYSATAILGYLVGSIPTGFLVAKLRGIDIRHVGSGNIGATNVFRALGKPAAILVLVIDGLKGYAACEWLGELLLRSFPSNGAERETLKIIGGVFAILGHNYTCWLKFKGGKGIATSAGVLAALVPFALLIILAIWSGQRLPIYAVLFIAAWVTALSYASEIMLFVPVMWLLGRLNQPRLAVPSAIGAVIRRNQPV